MQKVWVRVPLTGATINPYQLQRIDRDKRKTWDITIFKAMQLNHNRPDISVVHKDTQEWALVDIAVPADQGGGYHDQALEIKRIHRARE